MSKAQEGNGCSASPSSVLAELVDRLAARMQAGEAVDWEAVAREHPEHAGELRGLLPALGGLDELSRSGDGSAPGSATPADGTGPLAGLLGDFRIVREVGRGGMGVVYEAEQISLKRRVALKVLPLAATMDPRHLQRFRNEAQAAAGLHHTNIVPVHAVGSERGVHFYAMQYIDGQPLSEVIRQLRGSGQKARAASGPEPTTAYQPPPDGAANSPTAQGAADITPLPGAGRRGREYFRRVAELGVQAAEALDHAHQLGIVHRDVKPANLLLDSGGRLWVTDFGLAQMQQAEASLTRTGDLVGTLRYMSPEQALARRVVIDHRTDVYSLGATLYELLTLRPAFGGSDRQELLRQIAFEEPVKPRRLEREVPAELETIVLKAMEKRPQDRYATAQELADDLRRWLEDRPILARPPTGRQRLRKWGRRHQSAVVSAAVLLVLVSLGSLVSVGLITSAYSAEAKQRAKTEGALAEVTRHRQRAEINLQRALRLADQLDTANVGRPVTTREDLNLLTPLFREAASVWDVAAADYPGELRYARQRFVSYSRLGNLLAQAGQFQEAAQAWRRALDGVDKWATDFSGDRMVRATHRALRAECCAKLGDVLRATGEVADAEGTYARALALYEEERQARSRAGGQGVAPIWCWLVAIHNSLGGLRLEAGQLPEARQAYATALALLQGPLPADLQSDLGWPARQALELGRSHNGLGEVLLASGATKEATDEFREALRWHERLAAGRFRANSLAAQQACAWFLVACPIKELRDPMRAIVLARQNIERLPQGQSPWLEASRCRHTLAVAQYRAGDWKAARETLVSWPGVQPSDGPAAFVWAMTLWQLGQKKEARDTYDGIVRWMDRNRPRDLQLRRLRAEAAELLGVKERSPSNDPK